MSRSGTSQIFGIIQMALISSVETDGYPTYAGTVIVIPKTSEDVVVRPSM